jgi:hypothetical protein
VGKRLIRPTEEFTTELPYSEVCMHLRVAGTTMHARLQANRMVQLLRPDGTDFSFPITDGEAGLYTDEQGAWLITADEEPEQLAEDPPTDPQVADRHRARMLLDPVSEPLAVTDPRTWRGEVIDGPGGSLYWHPDLGYVSVPDPEEEP